jgi:ATP-dependent RNA/DNA helicase IGHMBP2
MFSPPSSSSSSSEKKKKKKSTSIEAVPIRVLFPKSANARQRAILHEFAAKYGLKHYSIGDAENKTRRIVLEKLLNDEEKCSANIVEIDEDESDGTSLSEPTDEYLCDIVRTHFQIELKSFDEYDNKDDNVGEKEKQKNRNFDASTAAASMITISEWTTKTLQLLEMERVEEIAQSLDALNTSTTTSKKGQHKNALDGLKIVDARGGLLGQTIVTLEVSKRKMAEKDIAPPLPTHSFSPHDVVRLRPSNIVKSEEASTSNSEFPQGVIYRIRDSSLELALDDVPEFLDVSPLRLEKLSNEQTHKKLVSAVQGLQRALASGHSSGKNILEIVFESASPRIIRREDANVDEGESIDHSIRFHPFNDNLDFSQKRAIQLCLDCVDVGIIHGPPGTGKTTAVVEYVSQEVARGNRVLVCSASNVAVDNVVERLSGVSIFRTATVSVDNKKKKGRRERKKKDLTLGENEMLAVENQSKTIVRYGHPARLAPAVLDASLDAYILRSDDSALAKECSEDSKKIRTRISKLDYRKKEDRAERNDLRKELRELAKEEKKRQKLAQAKTLENASVICATLAGALSFALKNEEFDVVVVDEAAQALECAVLGVCVKGKKLVLAGDHLQLPPTVLSDEAAHKGLSTTLFERLVTNRRFGSKITTMLNTQYRMHEDIMVWSSNAMYDSKLIAAESVRFRKFEQFDKVLTLIDTTGADDNFTENVGDDDDDSKSNVGEAEVVMQTIEKFLSDDYKILPNEIGVITPYSGQVSLLREMRAARAEENALFKDIEISTVDGFQGREKEAIIISTVRSNENNEVGFLSDARRMNVAVTRARKHVTLICNCETVSKDSFLANLVQYFEENGELVSSAQLLL